VNAVTVDQLIDQLSHQTNGMADDWDVDQGTILDTAPVYAGIHDGLGTRWFKVTGVAPYTAPAPGGVMGVILELEGSGTTEGPE